MGKGWTGRVIRPAGCDGVGKDFFSLSLSPPLPPTPLPPPSPSSSPSTEALDSSQV